MLVVLIMASYFINKAKKEAAVQAASAAPAAASVPEAAPARNLPAAPGSAGELTLYDEKTMLLHAFPYRYDNGKLLYDTVFGGSGAEGQENFWEEIIQENGMLQWMRYRLQKV